MVATQAPSTLPVPFEFGADFQLKLVKSILVEQDISDALLDLIKPEYFTSSQIRWIIEELYEYRKRYNSVPTIGVFVEKAKKLDGRFQSLCLTLLHKLERLECSDLEFVKDQTLSWAQQNMVVAAHRQVADLYEQNQVGRAVDYLGEAFDKIKELSWSQPDRGWLFEELATRERVRSLGFEQSQLISTGFDSVDKLLGGGCERGFFGIWIAYPKGGKALESSEPVLTPTGWTPIGELQEGDWVIGGSTGEACRVQGVFPQGEKECYRVTFSDGASVVASGDHLWTVRDRKTRQWRGTKWKVVTTLELLSDQEGWVEAPSLPHLPTVEFTGSEPATRPLDPYLLGLLLGDGSFCHSTVLFSKPERDLWDSLEKALPPGDEVSRHRNNKSHCDYISIIRRGTINRSVTAEHLGSLGLWGKRSSDKFVPEAYLWAPAEDRYRLLCGLSDTDGYVTDKGNSLEFSSASKVLAENVLFLVRSLSGVGRLQEKRVNGTSYWIVRYRLLDGRVPVCSRKNRKKVKPRKRMIWRKVTSVEPVGLKDSTCITVSDPESLFVTKDFIVTHNSILLVNQGAAAVKQGKKVLHFVHEGSRALIENRYDTCFSGQLYKDVKRGNLSDAAYKNLYEEYKTYSRMCVVRGMTDRWDYTILDLETELVSLKRRYGWVPDQIIVDYGDLLTPRGGMQRMKGWEGDRLVYRDLKALANRGYVLWTVSQVGRPKMEDFMNVEHILTSKDVAGGYDKVRVADFVGSINSTLEEREKTKVLRLAPEVVRDSPAGGVLYVHADFGRMKFGGGEEFGYGAKIDLPKAPPPTPMRVIDPKPKKTPPLKKKSSPKKATRAKKA